MIDLNGWYTVNADGSKSVDMTQVVSPTLLAVLEKSNNSAYNPQNKILTISPKEKVTKIQAGFDYNSKPTYWTFFTEMTNINDCVVRFESNGGTDISDQIVEYGKLAVEPQQPTKPGYVFKGWYLDQEMKKAYDFSNVVTDNIQLYAKWEKNQGNQAPTISANDRSLSIGDKFNPLEGVTANDQEDGDLTGKIEVIKNEVDTSKAGVYEVTYKVTDSQGLSSIKTIQVSVNEKNQTDDQGKPEGTIKPENSSKPTTPGNSDNQNVMKNLPKTGDSTNTTLWLSLLGMSGISGLAVLKKRK